MHVMTSDIWRGRPGRAAALVSSPGKTDRVGLSLKAVGRRGEMCCVLGTENAFQWRNQL
jgi:hypothetical protein